MGGTTLDFGKDDTCGWHIKVDSQYLGKKTVNITIEKASFVNCYINTGKNITNAQNEVTCYKGQSYTFDAD